MQRTEIYRCLSEAHDQIKHEVIRIVESKFNNRGALVCYLMSFFEYAHMMGTVGRIPLQIMNNTYRYIEYIASECKCMPESLECIPRDMKILNKQLLKLNKSCNLVSYYWHFHIAFEAFKKGRYDCTIKNEKTFIFNHATINDEQYALEAWYLENRGKILPIINTSEVLISLIKADQKKQPFYSATNVLVLSNNFQNSYEFLTPEMENGLYSIKEYQLFWSFLLIWMWSNRFQYLGIGNKSVIIAEAGKLTGLSESTIINILHDILFDYNNGSQKNIYRTPIFETNDAVLFSSPLMLAQIMTESMIHKTWQLKYKNVYDYYHTQQVEPKICENIAEIFKNCDRYLVATPKEYYQVNNSGSQIDVVVYDKVENSILIIEAKDHLGPVATLQMARQDTLEKNMLYDEKGAVSQLERQESIIRNQDYLKQIFGGYLFDSMDTIVCYKAISELHYVGTYELFNNLADKNITFMPYYLLLSSMKNILSRGLSGIVDYFLKRKFTSGIKYETTRLEKVDLFGYKFDVPIFINHATSEGMRKLV